MKKKETVEDKLTTLLLLQSLEQTRLFIAFYEEQYTFYNKLYYDSKENEPFKFFKKQHKKWETQQKELFSHISDIEEKKFELYKDLEVIMDELYGTKKEPSK